VVGPNNPPWRMIELDIRTGEEVGEHLLTDANWREIWTLSGLDALRGESKRWVERRQP